MMHFWIKEPNDWGIFISISDLTSDVKQQVDDLVDAGYHIRYIVGGFNNRCFGFSKKLFECKAN